MKIKYAYLKDEFQNPIVTIAYLSPEDGSQVARYSATIKNSRDNFSRPLGRHIAGGRLAKTPIEVTVEASGQNIRNYDVLAAIVSHLLYSSRYSTASTPGSERVRAACRRWLEA